VQYQELGTPALLPSGLSEWLASPAISAYTRNWHIFGKSQSDNRCCCIFLISPSSEQFSNSCGYFDTNHDQDQKAQEAQIRERMRMAERQAHTGMVMQSIASAEMDRLRRSLESSEPGKQRKLSASEIARFMEIGSKLERSARGEPGADSVAKIEVIFGNSEDDDEESGV